MYRFTWEGYSDEKTPANFVIETSINVYRNGPVVYFSLLYTSGLAKASIPDDPTQTVSTFPSFIVEEADLKRGYLTWAGNSKYLHSAN